VKIKGFRQGKVPRQILEQFYKSDTEAQVLERVLGSSFEQAIKNHAIQPVANPQIQNANELISGMDFSYSAKVEIKPTIDIKVAKGIALTKTTYEVGEAQLNKELEALRGRAAKVSPVEDRDVLQQGDLVEADWSGSVDGEHVKGLSGVRFVIELGGGNFYPEAEQALVGKKVGDMVNVDVKLPEDFRVEAVRGKTAALSIKPVGIKQKTLPALDDEFAKDISDEFESLAQLKEQLEKNLATAAENRTKNELRDGAIRALIEGNPFEVPSALVERQAQQIAMERLQRLPKEQAEAIWQAQGQRMTSDAKEMALRTVRISLILEELVKREGFEVTDADIEAHFEKMSADLNTPVKTIKSVYKKGNRMEELKFQLSTNRMMDKVLADAKIENKTAPLS
jgi:trigger factor